MKKELGVLTLVCLLLMIVTANGFSATKEKKFKKRRISEDIFLEGSEDQLSHTQPTGLSKYPVSVRQYDLTCADISPEMGSEYIIQHDQIGHTWYDYQKNGSMGRMISVTSSGYRHFSWMFADGPYPGIPRYVDANCKDPLNQYLDQVHVYGGDYKNAGYSNQAHLNDGRSLVIYHRTAGQLGDPVAASMLSIEDSLCTGEFNSFWDLPDSILNAPSGGPGMWPKAAVWFDAAEEKDYIHVVMTEGSTSHFLVMLAYERCHLGSGDSLICRACVAGTTVTYRLAKNTNYSDPSNIIACFDSSASITPVPLVSPVSARVAVAFLKPACDGSGDYMHDVCFIESMSNGDDWIDGSNYPPPEYNVTSYGCGYPEEERAYCDLSACYDYNDSLHIVWSTVGFPEPSYIQPGVSKLYHWSKQTASVRITSAVWPGTDGGSRNANIAKMSISAQDPIHQPRGDDSYLYCIWTQFDTTTPQDNSDADYTNGEIYGCGSTDGGSSWGRIYNLTRTRTPGCTPGTCVSEHWSSLAQNMYDGDLHVQYICDRHPGTALPGRDEGSVWVDNPVMYLHLSDWEGTGCQGPPYWDLVDPPGGWHKPPLKVTPDGSRNLTLEIGNPEECPEVAYSASSDHSCIQIGAGGMLQGGESLQIVGVIDGSGVCEGTFIQGNVNLTLGYCMFQIPVHAVVADDYYECPIDPETFDTVETSGARVYVNANSMEWIHDISSYPDTVHEVFMRGGSIVATSIDGNKVVGRFMGDNDWRSGVRDKLYTDWCEYEDYDCWVLYTKNTFINSPPNPPHVYHCYWYWWEWSKQIKVCEMGDRIIVIKYITVKRHDPPTWWPEADPPQGAYAGHEDTYVGIAMDIDCPWDTLGDESARNLAGYDEINHIAWQQGWGRVEEHPEYDNYFAGMALADPEGEPANYVPYAAHNVKNNVYLYPQSPWGWDDEELYDLCAAAGYTVQDIDSLLDRSQVLVAKHIPAGNDPDAEVSFVVVEVATPDGLSELQALVDTARAMVTREYYHGFPILCGDVKGDHIVELGDVVWLLTYLFKGSSPPACPLNRADSNSDGIIDIGDAVVLLNYLFKGGDPPECPGIW